MERKLIGMRDLRRDFNLVAGEPMQERLRKLTLAARDPRYAELAVRHLGLFAKKLASYAVDLREQLIEEKRAHAEASIRLERAKAASVRDPLTGLYNRLGFEERWEVIFARLKRGDRDSAALLFIDLNDFKEINDGFGHALGDKALISYAARLKSLSRDEDVVVRHGGDEFIVILGSIKDAERTLANLRARMNGIAVTTDESYEVAVNASYGLSVITSQEVNTLYNEKTAIEVADLIKKEADARMYKDKERIKALKAEKKIKGDDLGPVDPGSVPPVPEL